MRGWRDIPTLGAMLLTGCGPSLGVLSDGVVGSVLVDVAIVDPPEGVVLDVATLRVDALILDRCDDVTSVIVADTVLDGLGPSADPPWIPPGGFCGLHLVLPDDPPALFVAGTVDGAPLEEEIPLNGVAVLTPFLVGGEGLLLVLDLAPILEGPVDEGPVLAEPVRDVDGDGQLSQGDVPLDGSG